MNLPPRLFRRQRYREIRTVIVQLIFLIVRIDGKIIIHIIAGNEARCRELLKLAGRVPVISKKLVLVIVRRLVEHRNPVVRIPQNLEARIRIYLCHGLVTALDRSINFGTCLCRLSHRIQLRRAGNQRNGQKEEKKASFHNNTILIKLK